MKERRGKRKEKEEIKKEKESKWNTSINSWRIYVELPREVITPSSNFCAGLKFFQNKMLKICVHIKHW